MNPALVVDASVTIAIILREPDQSRRLEPAKHLWRRHQALVPSLWCSEVANALLVRERRKLIAPVHMAAILDSLAVLPIGIDQEGIARAFTDVLQLARAHELTVYDAHYLELAMRLRLPLATLDRALAKAAKKAGVELLIDDA